MDSSLWLFEQVTFQFTGCQIYFIVTDLHCKDPTFKANSVVSDEKSHLQTLNWVFIVCQCPCYEPPCTDGLNFVKIIKTVV